MSKSFENNTHVKKSKSQHRRKSEMQIVKVQIVTIVEKPLKNEVNKKRLFSSIWTSHCLGSKCYFATIKASVQHDKPPLPH